MVGHKLRQQRRGFQTLASKEVEFYGFVSYTLPRLRSVSRVGACRAMLYSVYDKVIWIRQPFQTLSEREDDSFH